MVKIKICGIKDLATAELCAQLEVDFIGFVFAESSRRVSVKQAIHIVKMLPTNLKKVGVFVDEEIAVVRKTAAECGLDFIQLHGNETPEYCKAVEVCKVIKAFKIDNRQSLRNISDYQVDYILLDSYSPLAKGGSGKAFNWDLLRGSCFSSPVILAGGLDSDNVKKAIAEVTPYAVDVSSGVEVNGLKDTALIKTFVETVRGSSYVA